MKRLPSTMAAFAMMSALFVSAEGIQPAGGLYKPADNGFYSQASSRYSSFTVNGTEVPVLDGYNNLGDYLGYDVVRFTATKGTATTARVTCTSPISSITVRPLMLGIEPVKIDDNTYEFEVPDPAETPYYLYVDVNNNHIVVARDEQYDAPASSGDGIFNVADYLAASGTDATKKPQAKRAATAFQEAIDAASEYGSQHKHGVVYVPDGVYYLGNLILKSNIDLYLSDGAVLRATDTKSDYRVDYHKNSLGRDGTWWISTVNDPENPTRNVSIYSHGSIDANGYYWQKRLSSNSDRFCITALHIIHAENVSVDGITVMQTPMWGTMLGRSNDITFTNVKFLNSTDANENDGIDVNESQRVTVDRAIGIALDDPFSTKTWMGQELFKNWTGVPEALDDVTFNHCVSWTYCGGFKMGHGAQQKQSNVKVLNGVVLNSGRALGVEPKYVNDTPIGGFHDVLFENIDIEHASGEGWLKILAETPGVGYPPIKNVTLRNINIRQKSSASSLRGTNDEFFVDGVTFDNITMYGNNEPVKTLSELNITNTGFYKNVRFVQDASHETDHLIEAEYCNEMQSGAIVSNNGSDTDYPGGAYVSNLASGKYLLFRNVDFGSSCTGLTLRVLNTRSTFKVLVRLDNADGDVVAEKQFARNADGWTDVNLELKGVSGTHNLYLSFEHVSGPSKQLGGMNHLIVNGRTVNDLTAMEPIESPLKVNILTSKELSVNFVPADAYQREIEWHLVSMEPEGCVSLSREGVVTANTVGKALVEARSTWNSDIAASFEIEAVDELTFDTLRIEVEDADEIYSPYHYDAAMSIGNISDPEDEGGRGLNSCWNTNFAVYKDIDFGEGAVKATIRKGYVRGSAMEIWIDPIIDSENQTISGGTKIAEIEYPAIASDWSRWATFETPVIADCAGMHTMVLYFKAGGGSAANQNYGAYNWIEFRTLEKTETGIESTLTQSTMSIRVVNGEIVIESEKDDIISIYSIDGRCVRSQAIDCGITVIKGLSHGMYIVNKTKILL